MQKSIHSLPTVSSSGTFGKRDERRDSRKLRWRSGSANPDVRQQGRAGRAPARRVGTQGVLRSGRGPVRCLHCAAGPCPAVAPRRSSSTESVIRRSGSPRLAGRTAPAGPAGVRSPLARPLWRTAASGCSVPPCGPFAGSQRSAGCVLVPAIHRDVPGWKSVGATLLGGGTGHQFCRTKPIPSEPPGSEAKIAFRVYRQAERQALVHGGTPATHPPASRHCIHWSVVVILASSQGSVCRSPPVLRCRRARRRHRAATHLRPGMEQSRRVGPTLPTRYGTTGVDTVSFPNKANRARPSRPR